jgi:hypothetical protein
MLPVGSGLQASYRIRMYGDEEMVYTRTGLGTLNTDRSCFICREINEQQLTKDPTSMAPNDTGRLELHC